MKTILFILPNLKQGGAERVITILCNELDRKLFCPKLVLFKKEGEYLNLIKDDVEIIELNISRIRYSIFKIIPLINKIKPDIVFTGWGEISAFLSPLIPLFKKTKFITRETNVVYNHVTRREILFFYRFYNNFDKIIAQSDDMKLDLIKNFNIKEEKIIKINNPVDFELINKLKEKNINTDFDTSYKNILAIGNLSPRKGFDLLLNVMYELKNEKIKLTILGNGDYKDKLIELKESKGLDNVFFKGNVSNPFVYLKNANLFILSSRYEGFPNVLLEAGACGTYSVVNNCPGGINEIIEPSINGEICDITNPKNFAYCIRKNLEKKFNEDDIIKSIYSRFNKQTILKKYENLLIEL